MTVKTVSHIKSFGGTLSTGKLTLSAGRLYVFSLLLVSSEEIAEAPIVDMGTLEIILDKESEHIEGVFGQFTYTATPAVNCEGSVSFTADCGFILLTVLEVNE